MFLGNHSTDISLHLYIYKYTAAQTFGIRKISHVFKRVSSAHYGCIYSIKNTEKTAILWNIIAISNIGFLCEYVLNCNLFLYFQHHYSSLQCHMIFRNHNNILIYYECWNSSYCFLEHLILYNNIIFTVTHPSWIKLLISKKKKKKKKCTDSKILNSIKYSNTFIYLFLINAVIFYFLLIRESYKRITSPPPPPPKNMKQHNGFQHW